MLLIFEECAAAITGFNHRLPAQRRSECQKLASRIRHDSARQRNDKADRPVQILDHWIDRRRKVLLI